MTAKRIVAGALATLTVVAGMAVTSGVADAALKFRAGHK